MQNITLKVAWKWMSKLACPLILHEPFLSRGESFAHRLCTEVRLDWSSRIAPYVEYKTSFQISLTIVGRLLRAIYPIVLPAWCSDRVGYAKGESIGFLPKYWLLMPVLWGVFFDWWRHFECCYGAAIDFLRNWQVPIWEICLFLITNSSYTSLHTSLVGNNISL